MVVWSSILNTTTEKKRGEMKKKKSRPTKRLIPRPGHQHMVARLDLGGEPDEDELLRCTHKYPVGLYPGIQFRDFFAERR